MTLLIEDLPGCRIPDGMVTVHWVLKGRRMTKTVEIDEIERIRASQFVVPDHGVYDVVTVTRCTDGLVAFCWPASA